MMNYLPLRQFNITLLIVSNLLFAPSCQLRTPYANQTSDIPSNETEFTILQLNDVYEINPVEGGTKGGLARVATIRQNLLAETPNVVTVLAGDFLSPSAMGTVKLDGAPVNGKQMVETLNTMGLDYVTIGNHELDMGEQPMLDRIAESKFTWISSNMRNGNGEPYRGVIPFKVVELQSPRGLPPIRLGMFGVTLDLVKKPFVQYSKPADVAVEMSEMLGKQSDVVVALTHLTMTEDKEVAAAAPRIDLVLGGHEHEHVSQVAGADNTPIFKADSNARTVYIHKIKYNFDSKKLYVKSELKPVDANIPEEVKTATVAKNWTSKIFTALRDSGINPEEVVGMAKEDYDGIEASVRSKSTNLTRLIGEAYIASEPLAEAAVFGGGAIRIDDHIMPGPITQWDIIRIFPFGGKLILAEVTGDILLKTLAQGDLNKGSGGYLHHSQIAKNTNGVWQLKGKDILANKTYKILFNEFLLTGQEKGMSYLKLDPTNTAVKKIKDSAEVRAALISKLKKLP